VAGNFGQQLRLSIPASRLLWPATVSINYDWQLWPATMSSNYVWQLCPGTLGVGAVGGGEHLGDARGGVLATKERGEKKFGVKPFFVATNFTTLKIILFFKC
jgi:hypothetical protein